jgi:hypothetical protein
MPNLCAPTMTKDTRIAVLRAAANRMGVNALGRKLRGDQTGYPSQSIVSQAVRGIYPGDMEKFWRVVDGVLCHAHVQCPELGSLASHHCIAYQDAPYNGNNALQVRMFRACQHCPNRLEEKA